MNHIVIKNLSGNSGCSVTLNRIGKFFFVRKSSQSISYNERLVVQKNKQAEFTSSVFKTPGIIDDGYKDGLFFFDMEYVAGESLAQLLTRGSLPQITLIGRSLDRYFVESQGCYDKAGELIDSSVFAEKVQSLKLNLSGKNDDVDEAFRILDSFRWPSFPLGRCHGDMSCENILISLSRELYLIDFLDSYCDNVCSDLSKLFIDLLIGWSVARLPLKNAKNSEVRLDYLRKIIESWADDDTVVFQGLLDLLRILPYVTNSADQHILDSGLKKLLSLIEKERLIEHPHSSVRGQVY